MKIINNIKEIRKQVKDWKNDGLSVALVPNMGYLHEGHESLIKKASEDNDKVIVSIFVNPMQFGINEDLSTYPRDINRDSDICKKNGASLIFNPNVEETGVKALIQKFSDVINNVGKVENVEEMGKRKLAYEIKKNKEGYYVVINFEAQPELIKELERIYRITDEVIKFIVVRKDEE